MPTTAADRLVEQVDQRPLNPLESAFFFPRRISASTSIASSS
jgi:hypothetical protein